MPPKHIMLLVRLVILHLELLQPTTSFNVTVLVDKQPHRLPMTESKSAPESLFRYGVQCLTVTEHGPIFDRLCLLSEHQHFAFFYPYQSMFSLPPSPATFPYPSSPPALLFPVLSFLFFLLRLPCRSWRNRYVSVFCMRLDLWS